VKIFSIFLIRSEKFRNEDGGLFKVKQTKYVPIKFVLSVKLFVAFVFNLKTTNNTNIFTLISQIKDVKFIHQTLNHQCQSVKSVAIKFRQEPLMREVFKVNRLKPIPIKFVLSVKSFVAFVFNLKTTNNTNIFTLISQIEKVKIIDKKYRYTD